MSAKGYAVISDESSAAESAVSFRSDTPPMIASVPTFREYGAFGSASADLSVRRAHMNARIYPTRRNMEVNYVAVHTVTRGAGGIVFLVSILSLFMTWATNFSMIEPRIAVMVATGSAFFFLMGTKMRRGAKANDTKPSAYD